jgi:hypothetical protein
LRDLLGDERFDAHWHAGRTLSFDAALAAGLAAAAGVPPKSSSSLGPAGVSRATVHIHEPLVVGLRTRPASCR